MSDQQYWSRFWQKRLSRRRALGTSAAAGAGIAGLALVGCGDDDDDSGNGNGEPTNGNGNPSATATGEPGAPQQGGEIVLSTGASNTQSMDPHITLNRAFFYWGIMQSKLVNPHPQDILPLEGQMVESWEQVDDTTLNLTVRSGINWHANKRPAGRALNAEDVAFNLNRIAGKLDPDRVAQFQRAGTLVNLDTAEAVDEMTVRVSLTAPNSQFVNGMADWRNWPVAPEDVEADPNFNDLAAVAGVGPFIIDSWDPNNQTGEFSANPDYWGEGPYLDRVIQASLPDTAATQAAFLSGDLSFLSAIQRDIRDSLGDDYPLVAWEHTGWEYFRLNQAVEPFTNPDVRRAIFLALNYKELLDANYGEGYYDYTGPLVSGFPGVWTSDEVQQLPGFNPNTRDEDIAEARALMEAAGFPNGEIEWEIYPSGNTGAWFENAVRGQDMLLQIWPDMNVSIVADTTNFFRDLATGSYQAATYGSFPPPSAVLEGALHYSQGGTRNYTKYQNDQVDSLIAQALAEYDSDAQAALLGDLQQILYDEIFAIPVGKRRGVYALQPNVRGFEGWSGPGTYETYDPFYAVADIWLES